MKIVKLYLGLFALAFVIGVGVFTITPVEVNADSVHCSCLTQGTCIENFGPPCDPGEAAWAFESYAPVGGNPCAKYCGWYVSACVPDCN